MIVVQEIVTWWTKASRAAPTASLRNAVPDTLPLPYLPALPEAPAVLHHTAAHYERDGFAHPEQTLQIASPDEDGLWRFGCVRVHPEPGAVRVVYAYDMTCGGAPERTSYPRQVLALEEGQTGRLIYNGRFADGYEGTWVYRRVVVNVGHLEALTLHPFPEAPSRTFEDVATLL